MMELMRKGRLQYSIALFFLIFTVADILLPQFCNHEDDLIAPITSPNKNLVRNDSQLTPVEIAFRADDSGSQQAPEQTSDTEDCFCCCSHLLPARSFSPGIESIKPSPNRIKIPFLPAAPPRGQFHPPRSA